MSEAQKIEQLKRQAVDACKDRERFRKRSHALRRTVDNFEGLLEARNIDQAALDTIKECQEDLAGAELRIHRAIDALLEAQEMILPVKDMPSTAGNEIEAALRAKIYSIRASIHEALKDVGYGGAVKL